MTPRSHPVPRVVERTLDSALDQALRVQRPAVLGYLARVRAQRPHAGPAQVLTLLERRYRTLVMGIGGASGASAAVPGVGTGAALATGAAEITAFVAATALYVLAVAEVYGVPVDDIEVRRALVLTVLVGDAGIAAVEGTAREAPHWAQMLGRRETRERLAGLNGRLTHLLVARFGARQGALLVGRALPLGIGAGVGAVGNAALARGVIGTAQRIFGPPPAVFAVPPAIEPPRSRASRWPARISSPGRRRTPRSPGSDQPGPS